MTHVAAALIAALAVAPQTRTESRAPETDQTVDAPRGARLILANFAGEIVVRAWDRDAVRVQARHATRVRVDVRSSPSAVHISSHAQRGPTGSVDYEISAPAWMPLRIEGQFAFVTIEGSQAEVSIETVRGDLTVKGGTTVTARSVEGTVTVEGAKGRINVSSVNEGIVLTGVAGEVSAETVNGPITMTQMNAAAVEAGTINGEITYEGTVSAGGRYRLTSHNGGIVVGVPENSNATFAVRTYNGSFRSTLTLKGEGNVRQGRRVVYTLGSGSAEFEIETFSGDIRVGQPGGAPAKSKGGSQ